jgi:hypothetical protein
MKLRGKPKNYSQLELETTLKDAFNSEKLILTCPKHMYAGEGYATEGCYECNMAYWMRFFARVDPKKRAEMIDTLSEVSHKMAELVEKNEFDIHLFPHAQIEYEKDALDDKLKGKG